MSDPFFEYDVFVSYRTGLDPDRSVAEELQRVLETFPVPGGLKNKAVRPGRWRTRLRVFRDILDLNASPDLTQAIQEKLRRSRFFVVVCTPSICASAHCAEEIRFFRKHRGDRFVLPLLVAGEPVQSFPLDLTWQEETAGMPPASPVIPLAADIRAESTEGNLRKLRGRGIPKPQQARFKLLAPILGCRSPDELVGRHDARIRAELGMVLATLVVAVLAVAAGVRNYNEKDRVERQYSELGVKVQKNLNAPVITENSVAIAAMATTSWRHRPSSDAWNAMQRVPMLREQGFYYHDDLSFESVIVVDKKPVPASLNDRGELTTLDENDAPGTIRVSLPRHISRYVISPDSLMVAAAAEADVYVAEIASGKIIHRLQGSKPAEFLAFSRDGKFLATATSEGTAFVWSLKDGSQYREQKFPGAIRAIAISVNAKYLACAVQEGENEKHVHKTDLQMQKELDKVTLFGDGKRIQLAFSPDGELLTVLEPDSDTRVVSAGNQTHHFGVPAANADHVELSPDGRYLATARVKGEFDYVVQIESVMDGYQIQVAHRKWRFAGIDFSPDGRILAVEEEQTSGAGGIGMVNFWSFDGPDRELQRVSYDTQWGRSAISRDGQRMAIQSEGGEIRILNVENGQEIQSIGRGSEDITGKFLLSPDARILATVKNDGSVFLWSVTDGTPIKTIAPLKSSEGYVRDIACTFASANQLTVLLSSGLARLISMDSTPEKLIDLHVGTEHEEVISVSLSPDGRLAAFLMREYLEEEDRDREILILYSVLDGKLISRSACSRKGANVSEAVEVSISPDGRFAAIHRISDDDGPGPLQVLKVSDGSLIKLIEHDKWAPMFSSDGQHLAVPGLEGAVHVLTTSTWNEVARINHSQLVSNVDFTAPHLLTTTGTDGSIRVWDVNWASMLTRLGSDDGRNLTRAEWAMYFEKIGWSATFDHWPTPKVP